ncbi:MAG: ABC transporter ATP-binding protein [Oscillospiraceae bacterium]|nr:ABC transporter ATP-binding protein [Oscillospiraceae bacterium]
MDSEQGIIVCEGLVKIYKTKDLEVLALQGLDLTIKRGELTAIIGNSGSGKSTLLNMLGGLDTPSAGKLFVDGRDLFKLTGAELSDYKRSTVGFIWQNNARNLIPYLNALDNICLPTRFSGSGKMTEKERKAWAMQLLDMVDLGNKAQKRLGELSGGEQQRVALAIALSNKPKILLADEPTGSVDAANCVNIMNIFRKFNEELGITVVIVTHDRTLTKLVNRVVSIRDGKVSSEFLAREETSGAVVLSHDEFAVLDRAGRVQIPEDYLKKLKLTGNTVRLALDNDRVLLSAPESA